MDVQTNTVQPFHLMWIKSTLVLIHLVDETHRPAPPPGGERVNGICNCCLFLPSFATVASSYPLLQLLPLSTLYGNCCIMVKP